MRPIVTTLALLAIGLGAARPVSADPLPPLNDPIDVPGPAVAILATPLFGLGDIDPTTLVVTDSELLGAGATFVTPPWSIDPTDVVVDDDRVQCPDAQFTSIQAAVLFAAPGGTIRVCPGTYRESVKVTKTLNIIAKREDSTGQRCQTPIVADPTHDVILAYPFAGTNSDEGFDLMADNIVLEGFVVEPLNPSISPLNGIGIFTDRNFSGYQVRHNIVEFNTIGIYANSAGISATSIDHNCLRLNNASGAAGGNGVYSDQGLRNAAIQHNFFTGQQNASVVLDTFLTTPANVTIAHNTMVNDSSIAIFNSTDITIAENDSSGSAGSAVFLGGNDHRIQIDHNRLSDGHRNGISMTPEFEAVPNSDVLVSKNKTTGFTLSGIRLAGNEMAQNVVIQKNRSEGNALDGVRASSTSKGYVIDENVMQHNGEHDCHDDSTGAGTAGTANTWTNDKGDTENRPGLCKHAVTP